ncbi:MAG: gluconate 2-dehydrogenase subunit 3 family protein [Gemmatimonadota bacterium]|nr:gluconate 2-dehydrogenase subunit 3 family protein [Gemmatimonadota bacterium]
MSSITEQDLITRREAILRVTALLGGVALVGGSGLLTACSKDSSSSLASGATFTADDAAFLDEVADTILPTTKTPGAKAAGVGPFMALMVTDSYSPADQKIFRDGMRALDDASRKANNVGFVKATPEQRLALLQQLDREQKAQADARGARAKEKARIKLDAMRVPATAAAKAAPAEEKRGDAYLPDQRKENTPAATGTNPAPAITDEPPTHYFRMMKELALLGYFTSEIGCTQAQHYVESPGRFDPCVPYVKGDPAQASHA